MTNGRRALVTLTVLGGTTAADDADAILCDPASKLVFTFNGDATIALGGKAEYGVSSGDGKLYANLEDKAEVVEIDAPARRVTRR